MDSFQELFTGGETCWPPTSTISTDLNPSELLTRSNNSIRSDNVTRPDNLTCLNSSGHLNRPSSSSSHLHSHGISQSVQHSLPSSSSSISAGGTTAIHKGNILLQNVDDKDERKTTNSIRGKKVCF